MRILFVCAHNRFRSKVAEKLFEFYDLSGRNEIKSAGVQIDLMKQYVSDSVYDVMAERGLKIGDEQARQLDEELIEWADKIVLVANNVNTKIFPKEKLEVWKIPDAPEEDFRRIRQIVNKIEEHVQDFVRRINSQ